jgi:hypothetical protein
MTTEISRKQYIQTYLYLIKKSKSEKLDDIFDYIEKSDVKDTTKLNYLNSIIGLKKHDPKLVKGDLSNIIEFRDKLNYELMKRRDKDNMTEKQRSVIEKVTSQDIEEVISKLNEEKNTNPKALEEYILLKLMFPQPLRNDLMELKISRQKGLLKEFNSIYLPSKKNSQATISIVDHKTSHPGNRRPITKVLDVELTNDIKKMVKEGNREYLFENGKGKPYSSSAFSHKLNNMFKRLLGVSFSSTVLRKLYHTDKYKDAEKEMKEDSKQMGHSVNTIRKNYIDNT